MWGRGWVSAPLTHHHRHMVLMPLTQHIQKMLYDANCIHLAAASRWAHRCEPGVTTLRRNDYDFINMRTCMLHRRLLMWGVILATSGAEF